MPFMTLNSFRDSNTSYRMVHTTGGPGQAADATDTHTHTTQGCGHHGYSFKAPVIPSGQGHSNKLPHWLSTLPRKLGSFLMDRIIFVTYMSSQYISVRDAVF